MRIGDVDDFPISTIVVAVSPILPTFCILALHFNISVFLCWLLLLDFDALDRTYLFYCLSISSPFCSFLFSFPVVVLCVYVVKMGLTNVLVLCLSIKIIHCSPEDVFHEELYLKNLPSGHIYAHFQFTTTWNTSLGDKNACMFAFKLRKGYIYGSVKRHH